MFRILNNNDFIALILIVILCINSYANASIKFSDRIEEYYLDNGLKVILLEDKRGPAVVSSTWYKVGSSYEYEGITGISHLLEHMMFKGTTKYKPGEFSRIIKNLGGSENAFTGRDFTGYYQKVHKDHLEECIKMESDRMVNLLLKPNELKTELEVVKEERRLRTEDNPIALAFEEILLQSFGYNGYGIPIVGTNHDLNKLTVSDVQSWYQRFYTPKNAILIIAGNFDRQKTKHWIEKYYSAITKVSENHQIKPTRHKIDYNTIHKYSRVSETTILMSFLNPKYSKENKMEHYALDLLLELMDGGYSSRFTKSIIDEKKLALETFISYESYPKENNIITLGGILRDGTKPEILQDAILDEFNKLINDGISDEELVQIKSRLIAENIYKFDSLFYQAMNIGTLETKNIEWNTIDQYLNDIDKITKQDIIEVAKKYITSKKFIFTIIEPEKI